MIRWLMKRFSAGVNSNRKEVLARLVEEKKSALGIKSNDVSIPLYNISRVYLRAFNLLKWQMILIVGGCVGYLVNEVRKIDNKQREMLDRNVMMVFDACKAHGVNPSLEPEKMKALIRQFYDGLREEDRVSSMPSLMRRRLKKSDELDKNKMYFALSTAGVLGMLLVGYILMFRIKKTFIHTIRYLPSEHKMDFELYTIFSTKTVSGVAPDSLRYEETMGKDNKVVKKYIVNTDEKLKGYQYFSVPGDSSWSGKEIFDEWLGGAQRGEDEEKDGK